MFRLDFDGAYLQGKADHKIYMQFPKDLNKMGIHVPEGHVALLKKSLYGLKQAGAVWWATLSGALVDLGFKQCDA